MKLSTYQDICRGQKREELLDVCIEDIEKVSCGEEQIQCDGSYNDSDGMTWVYKRIQQLKKDLSKIL